MGWGLVGAITIYYFVMIGFLVRMTLAAKFRRTLGERALAVALRGIAAGDLAQSWRVEAVFAPSLWKMTFCFWRSFASWYGEMEFLRPSSRWVA